MAIFIHDRWRTKRPDERASAHQVNDEKAEAMEASPPVRRFPPALNWITPVSCGLLAFLLRRVPGPVTADDAYITFRYARNLASGSGFVFNRGEHVLGTTTPLYTVLLAAAYRVGFHDLPSVSLTVAAAADAVSTVVLFRLARRLGLGPGWSTLASLLFAVCSLSVGTAMNGMESSLFTMFVVCAVASDCAEKPGRAALFASLATLTRPEGLIVALLVFCRHLLQRRPPPLRGLLIYGAILLPWITFAIWYFGSPLPQSAVAKSLIAQNQVDKSYAARMVIGMVGSPGLNTGTRELALALDVVKFLIVISLVWILANVFRRNFSLRGVRIKVRALPALAFAPVLGIAYAGAGFHGVFLFQWYLVPLAPFVMLAFAAWARALTRQLPRVVQASLAGVLIGWTFIGYVLPVPSREPAYAAAARFLAARAAPRTVVAIPEIGSFGYAYPDAEVLDTNALVSPHMLRYYPLPAGYGGSAVPDRLMYDEQPPYLVSLNIYLPHQLLDASWFRRDYRLIARFPMRRDPTEEVRVYERNGRPRQ
jgi:hypothetical protein